MKYLFTLLCCLLSLTSVNSKANEPSQATALQPLLLELTQAKLSAAIPTLTELEVQGGNQVLLLFQTLLAGDLYFLKSNHALLGISEQNGVEVAYDVISGTPLSLPSAKDVKKIRVNNKLRSHLKDAIARIQLSSTDASQREQAILALLSELTPSTVAAIRHAKSSEQDPDVLEAIDLALAMDSAINGQSEALRLDAIRSLSASLHQEVKNLLAQLSEDNSKDIRQAAAKSLATIEQKWSYYATLDQLFFGLSLGSVLLLAAIGLAITFGVMGVINMAHGEMIMLGAYTTYVVQQWMPNAINQSLFVALPLAFLVAGGVGVLIERGVIRYLHGRPLETLLATFGISLILQQLVRTVFSPLNRQVSSPDWMSGSLDINPALSLTLNRLYILAFAILVFLLLQLLLKKTSLGLNVRAVSQNRSMAKAMGVRTDWVDAMTFGLGSGIAGIAGVALSQLTNVGPNLGQSYIIDSFMVVVFGGVGNLLGTLVAAFSLGIANKFLEPLTGAVLAGILVLVFIILFIQKRPKGLFPQKGRAAE